MTTYKNLCAFLSDELSELDRRAKEKKLSNSELAYGDQVAALAYHLKKLEAEAGQAEAYRSMRAYDGGAGRSYRDGGSGRSYRNEEGNARRPYSGGAYHGENKELISLLEDMIQRAPDEHSRREMENMIYKLEEM